MKEELFISGRNIPNIDPHLNIWHLPIPIDLFLGGLAAGLLFFAGLFTVLGKEKELPTAVKWATIVAPIALVLALTCLFVDLKNQWNFWRLYTTFRIESPMSWGSWVLMFITPLSFLWVGSYLREWIPSWDWKLGILNKIEAKFIHYRKKIAWVMMFLALSLGIYTGILLSAFNARPLWNTALLGPLFLIYGLLTGAAVIMWMSRQDREKLLFTRISLILIGIVLFFIVHLFMGFMAGPEVQLEAASLFLEGKFMLPFWGLVVGAGLILPAILEISNLNGLKVPAAIPALLILAGGFIFRLIMVEAGEITRYLY